MADTALPSVVLVDSGRIPFQKSGTVYAGRTGYQLARRVIASLMGRRRDVVEMLDTIVLGTVIQEVNTSNLAREAALGAGLPAAIPAETISMACISSNAAMARISDAIQTGRIRAGLAVGAETMSDIPIRLSRPLRSSILRARNAKGLRRAGSVLGAFRPSHLIPDIPSIAEFSTGESMGQSCDRTAQRFGIRREDQDGFALRSHRLAAEAHRSGRYAGELLDAADAPGFEPVTTENGIRPDSSLEKLASLKPAFQKPYGTVTAGNASFLTDGASAALLASETLAIERSWPMLARILGFRFEAKTPAVDLLMGPALVIPMLLRDLGLRLGDIDVFEIHEAFAGQVLALLAALDSDAFFREHLPGMSPAGAIDMDRLNTWGGSLAIGHPFGATGIRLVSTAARRLEAEDGRLALIASCAAGGQAHAMVIERIGGSR